MSRSTAPRWKKKRTDETREVEKLLKTQFPSTDAYRYNSASIRVRIVDARFKGKSIPKRDALVEPLLKQLPEDTQCDIINLLMLYPGEPEDSSTARILNDEFEDPSPSIL